MAIAVVQTVSARTMAELRAARDAAVGDLVELRLDGVEDIDVAGALQGRRKPVIVTCRASWEGGSFAGDESTRLGLLAEAVRLGAEYVDVEWRADRRSIPRADGTRLILSHHDFGGMPTDLTDRVRAMASERPDVLKMAVTAGHLRDCLTLRSAMRMTEPHVAIAMGPAGKLTRLCPVLFGSAWTYGGSAAPGQVPASELVNLYRVGQQTAATAIYGVAGAPLAHSASPAMHNSAFVAVGLDAVYLPFETADAAELLSVGEAIGVKGVSVTAPLKTGTFALVGERDELTSRIGAINTLRHDGRRWEGRNYDVAGFLAPLTGRFGDLAGARAVVLGAGGAARTALWALGSRGARVEIAARRHDRAESLAREFGAAVAEWPPAPGWDLLVNTTPVGTWPQVEDCPIDPRAVQGRVVYDLIYNPEDTALLNAARANGADTIGGLEMLVAQARLQFEWWTGVRAPHDVMIAAARAFLARTYGHV